MGNFKCSNTIFSNVVADINPKEKNITLSVEVYNPYYAFEQDEVDFDQGYCKILETVESVFVEKYKKKPQISSSAEYGCTYDESITFSYDLKLHENNVRKFIEVVRMANDMVCQIEG